MKRITYMDSSGRVHFTKTGKHIYCSTQAMADTVEKYESLVEKLGYQFDDNSDEVQKSIEVAEAIERDWQEKRRREKRRHENS